MSEQKAFSEWCIIELMGHRRLAGFVSEVELFGGRLLRIDVPGEAGAVATQFYGVGSVYCLTVTTEATARAFAVNHQPAPVSRWELPALPEPSTSSPVPEDYPHGEETYVERDDD